MKCEFTAEENYAPLAQRILEPQVERYDEPLALRYACTGPACVWDGVRKCYALLAQHNDALQVERYDGTLTATPYWLSVTGHVYAQ